MKTVLHIAAHMGGGVGKVLSGLAIEKNTGWEHKIMLLEKPLDTQYTDRCDKHGVDLRIAPRAAEIEWAAGLADVVQFDWWNHPLMAKVMYNLRNVPMRSVVWSHTAGCHYPYISPGFVALPDKFVFSTRYSFENPHWNEFDKQKVRSAAVVNSSGGFDDTRSVALKPHEGFNVGYVGTLGYVKLHPDFVAYCKAISDIPGIRFVMIGRIPEPNLVLRDAIKAGIDDKFVFKGWVDNLPAELAQLDVLGYLLNPNHFGTTENAMLEAMSMGIPPVCINQCAEKYLIQDGENGILVDNAIEYVSAIRTLYTSKPGRKYFGARARDYVMRNLNIFNTVFKLNAVYSEVMRKEKRCVDFAKMGKTSYDWYLNGLPPLSSSEPNTVSKYLVDNTKSSVAQWKKYYPEDEVLAKVTG